MSEQRQSATERLKNLIPTNREPIPEVETVVLEGLPAKAIAAFALEHSADMIVVGTHGCRGLARMLMGSTAETLLHEAS